MIDLSRRSALALSGAALAFASAPRVLAQPKVAAEWTPDQAREILDKTQSLTLSPDLSHLSPGEAVAVRLLVEAGAIFQEVYELQRHRDAPKVRAALAKRTDAHGKDLATLYRVFQGPVATTLDNKRIPFVAVEDAPAGKNVYPWDLTKAEFEAYVAAHPDEQASLMHLRSVVRRADKASLEHDMNRLQQYPALNTLHPGLWDRLAALADKPDRKVLYALPYSVAFADQMVTAHGLLNQAADAVEPSDWAFARFLRNRSRDLLSDDYESGDAAWLKGRFKNLNAQIGAYETYDDELLGVRAFYSFSLLATRNEEGAALRKAMSGIQALEDSLPTPHHRKVAEVIPVGVYDVIADFGQSRGANTATNLPNEAYLTERYGNIILLRVNIMRNPDLFKGSGDTFGAAMATPFAGHLTSDANFYRTLWHEVGHYLGPDLTTDGREMDIALGPDASLLEEMKADLVSLFVAQELGRRGYYTPEQQRAVYASGILRTLQNNRPRREQPYNMMQLIQWNWFLDRKVLTFDAATAKMSIDYGRYHDAVAALLKEVLALQVGGDRTVVEAFIAKWGTWDEALHGVIATAIRGQQRYRYRLFNYAAVEA
ncbi:NUDIX hydrolase [Caulobacter sp. SLTY]|uniref:zincin-like metallopeptidase domain-containing protein n=1 Tax=Caulobacter sp. SLTY TaxID=2683262 RepID=UPI001412CB8C|nr:zincin-like metallopeptidase domain-containing protein [Caulobacter sp. SLTY]NBB15526.1 NUDIX hydrolase [Caulobacter sp. SLTY]